MNTVITTGILYVVGFLAWGAIFKAQDITPTTKLTKISNREWVDLSKVSFVQLPVWVHIPPSLCPAGSCQERWGGSLVVEGYEHAFTAEADDVMKKLVGKDCTGVSNAVDATCP